MYFNPVAQLPSRVTSFLQYSLLVLLSSLCYFFTRRGQFVFDDSVAVVKNVDVTNCNTTWQTLMQHDFWGANLTDKNSHKSFRPLTVLTFQQEVRLFGLDATQMKTTNWMLHTLIGVLLPRFFQVVSWRRRRRFGKQWRMEYWAAVLFVVHPIHTEAVSGIVGRAELLATVGFVLAVMIYGRLLKDRATLVEHVVVLTTVFILTATSVLCKETGITILATCAIIDILKHINLKHPIHTFLSNKPLIIRTSILFTLTCVLIYARLSVQNFASPQFRDKDNIVAFSHGPTKFLSQNYLYCLNLWLLLCPDWLSFDWALESIPLVKSFRDYRVTFIVIFYVFLVALLVRSRHQPRALTGLALMIIPFLPASGIIRVGFVIAERVLYIPSLGFCYLVSYGFTKLYEKLDIRWVRIAIGTGFLLLIITFVLRTVQRSAEWATEHSLFRSGLRVVPNNAKVHYNIAKLATDQGDKATAFKFYHQALDLYPEYEVAHMNLGNLYSDAKDYRRALRHLQKAIKYHEDFHTAWMNLGIVHAALKNHKEALVSYHRAMKTKKHYPNCMFNLGNLYNDMGNHTLALATWNETVRQDPKHVKAWNNMINVYDNANMNEQVLEVTARGLKHLPNNPNLLAARAIALAKLGNFLDAEHIYSDLIARHPDEEKYLQNMGVLYHRWRKLDQAERMYRKALKINPHSEMARNNLSKLLASRQKTSN
ncbi:protein O-mannosyl-transferase TMTC4 [Armigeres subalbatus]|uniref:protein O-mannosyl-transferase TMTC4 n=1 Tax=Armigeres subalbatus TaxID=124917 RepID=UPI002ED32C3D